MTYAQQARTTSGRLAGCALPIRTRAALLAFALMLVCNGGHAQRPDPYQGQSEWKPTDPEVALLPPYCQVRFRPQQYPGPGASAYGCGDWFNHFCPGLVAMNRAMNPLLPMKRRQGYLREANDHIAYTRKKLAPSCRLAPDVQNAERQLVMLGGLVK